MEETSAMMPQFKWRMSESYYMSIQLSLDGLSFCILDPVTNQFLMLGDVKFDAPDPNFAEHEKYMLCKKEFALRFRKVLISVESPAFMVMPLALYNEERIRDVLALTGINVTPDSKVIRNNIDLTNSTTVFAVPNFLYFFLRTQFPNAEIFHTTTPVVTSMLLKTQVRRTADVINITFNAGSMTLVATQNNELKLCNRYYCKEPLDYVYMILFVMNQLGFDVQTTSLIVSGDIRPDDIRLRSLYRFSQMVRMAQLPHYFSYGFKLPENPQKFNSLFLMPLCV